jgi:hypothetical protein
MKYFLLLATLLFTEARSSNDFIEGRQPNNKQGIQVNIQDLEQQGNLQHPVTESLTYVIDNVQPYLTSKAKRVLTGGVLSFIGGGVLPLAYIAYHDYVYSLSLSGEDYLYGSMVSPITSILTGVACGAATWCCSDFYEFYKWLTKPKQD